MRYNVPMTALQPVGAFDIDGTVFRSSLVVALTEHLIRAGIFPPEAEDEYADAYYAWVNREGDYDAYIDALVATFMRHIKGVHYADFADIAEAVVREQGKHTYRYTRDLIGQLKRDGYYLLAISQSPKTVVEHFAKQLGFDKVYGRLYETGPSDRFTGNIQDVHLIENKANIVRRAVEKEELTLAGSIGVGDTHGDIPLLELVERPICFNPNKLLYTHATRMGWEVVVERKDVIYELSGGGDARHLVSLG